jgi:Fe-S-cluster containining protein
MDSKRKSGNEAKTRTTGPSQPAPTHDWWSKGVRFQCQGSGKCCTSHGEFGFVFMTPEDRKRMARHLGMTTSAFVRKHCEKTNGAWHLIEDPKNPDCRFLKGKSCGVYEGRPTQCRTWPFWPEVMSAKSWKKEVVSFCPGVGKGPLISAKKIQEQLDEQKQSEAALLKEAT